MKRYIPFNFEKFSEKIDYSKHINNPSNIDFVFHGTNFPSSIWVTKNNKLASSKINLNRWISLSSNLKFYMARSVQIRGELCILWKLDFNLLKKDKIILQTNTQNFKRVDNYEILIKQPKLLNFSKYVTNTFVFINELERYYTVIVKNYNDIINNPSSYSKGTNTKDYLLSIGLDKFPESFDEFLKLYVKFLNKRFGSIKLVNKKISEFK